MRVDTRKLRIYATQQLCPFPVLIAIRFVNRFSYISLRNIPASITKPLRGLRKKSEAVIAATAAATPPSAAAGNENKSKTNSGNAGEVHGVENGDKREKHPFAYAGVCMRSVVCLCADMFCHVG